MSDLLYEQRVPLAQLAKQQDVNACTVWRWTKRGVRGVILETFSIGGKRYTTQEAFARFAEACTNAAKRIESAAVNLTKRQHEASIARAEDRFRGKHWPLKRPKPVVFYHPRSLNLGTGVRACLHAKCIVVDRRVVFVSSANFTEAAQDRNIEIGVLIRSPALAIQVTSFFDTLISQRALERMGC